MHVTHLLLSCALAVPAQAGGELDALIDAAGKGQPVRLKELVDALLSSGPQAAEEWRAALDLRRPGRDLLFPEDAPPLLETADLEALESLTHQVPQALLEREATLKGEEWATAARIGLGLLLDDSSALDLSGYLELATPPDDLEYSTYREVGRALASTLTRRLEHDRSLYSTLARRYGTGHSWLDLFILRGIAETQTYEALQILPSLLHAVPGLDVTVLFEISNVARTVKAPIDDSGLQRIRLYLTSIDADQRKQAALAAGRLNDYESVDPLIDLLDDEQPGVRTNAYWALREITAMTIDATPQRWRTWFDEETGWWAEEASDLLVELKSPDVARVCRAINECATKRLFRHQLTPPLVELLDHEDPTVVRAVCSALLALRATDAAPQMVRTLEHPDSEVRSHGLAMLRALTGLGLGPDARAWQGALSPAPMAR